MAKMKGYTWMGFGLVIAVASKIFSRVNDQSFLTLFFYLGIIFFFFGVIKLLFEKGSKPKENQERPRPTIINCASCNARNYSTSNFCHKCGEKLHSPKP